MQLLGLLCLLWMLKASPGATGTVSTATSISHIRFPRAGAVRAVLSNSPHSKDLAGWPLGVPQLASPAPGHRENEPMMLVTSPHDTLISETLLTSPVSSNTSTTPMSKFAFKVETTPPTVLVYSATTECVYPTSFTITISHPTSICVTTTQVAFTSSYTPTPVTQKPVTTVTRTYPMTTTEKGTSAVTSPSTTTARETPIVTVTPSSSVSATDTTFHTTVFSTIRTTERIPRPTGSVHTTMSPAPVFTTLKTAVTSTFHITSSVTSTDTVTSMTKTTSRPTATNTLSSPTTTISSSTPVLSTETITSGITNTTPLSTLVTTLPTTITRSTPTSEPTYPTSP
ncbi:hypothetical protein H8958_014727, partial [Nasalis larvatus]